MASKPDPGAGDRLRAGGEACLLHKPALSWAHPLAHLPPLGGGGCSLPRAPGTDSGPWPTRKPCVRTQAHRPAGRSLDSATIRRGTPASLLTLSFVFLVQKTSGRIKGRWWKKGVSCPVTTCSGWEGLLCQPGTWCLVHKATWHQLHSLLPWGMRILPVSSSAVETKQ